MHEVSSSNLVTFKREFRSMADLRHQNLVRLLELTDTGNEIFYTMEHVDGLNLRDVIAQRPNRTSELSAPDTPLAELSKGANDRVPPLPISNLGSVSSPLRDASEVPPPAGATDIERMYQILPQILDALECLHQHDMVHRDLKPDNILLTPLNEIKLVDFGIIKDLRKDCMTVRGTNQIVGTIEYMAPEQINSDEITPQTDLYALGCVLYEYLTGRLPFTGTAFEIMAQHLNERPCSVLELNPKVPSELAKVCECLLAKNPSERIGINVVRRSLNLNRTETDRNSKPAEPVFIGRISERAQMEAQLQRVAKGNLEISLIEGESGVGKTALAEAVTRYAKIMGFQVFRGRCYEREEIAFRAFDRIMDEVSVSLRRQRSCFTDAELEEVQALSWIFPSFGLLQKSPKPASWAPYSQENTAPLAECDPRVRRANAFSALGPLTKFLVRQKPVLFVIDDLHWADVESFDLLQALVENARSYPVMIVASCRTNSVPETHGLTQFLSGRVAQAVTTKHRLDPLSLDESSTLLRRLHGKNLASDHVQRIFEQSNGLPLFTLEMAEHLSTSLESLNDAPVPSMANLVQNRLSGLSDGAKLIVEFAATAGGASALAFLRKATELETDVFNSALDELLETKIIKPVAERDSLGSVPPPLSNGAELQSISIPNLVVPSYDFYHDCLRREAYELLSPERRIKLHRRLAEVLQAEEMPPAAALARHWRKAGYQRRAVVYGLKAAEDAARHLAFSQSIAAYENLLAEIETGDLLSGISDLSRSYERLAELYEFGGAYEQATHALERAIHWLPEGGTHETTLHRLNIHLAANLVKIGKVEHGVEIFECLLRSQNLRFSKSFTRFLLSCGTLRLRWLVSEFWSHLTSKGLRTPTEKQRVRLELFRKISESFGFVQPLHMAEFQMRFQLEAQGVDLVSAQVHATALEAIFQALTGVSSKFVQKAHRLLDEAQSLAHEAKVPFTEAYTLGVRGFIDCAMGSWARSRAELTEVIQGFQRQHALHRWEVQMCRAWLMLTEHFSGETESSTEIANDFVLHRNTDVVQYSLGSWALVETHLHRGEIEAARERLKEWDTVIDPERMTHFRFLYEISRNGVDNVHGRSQSVLHRIKELESTVKRSGCLLGAWDMALWNMAGLEAAVRLAENGKLFKGERKKAIRRARQIIRRAPKFFGCVAYRGLAILAHEAGNRKLASKHLRSALLLSEQSGVPHYRWLCLDAARRIGPFDASLGSEMLSLQKDFGFTKL